MHGDVLPQNLEAEQAVLGALLIDGNALSRVTRELRPEHFFLPVNQAVYRAMLDVADSGLRVDIVTLSDHLDDDAGGPAYLASLAGIVPTAVHVHSYARVVRRCAYFRSLIDVGQRITALGYQGGDDADAVGTQAKRLLDDVGHAGGAQTWGELEEMVRFNEGVLFGDIADTTTIPTGLKSLDNFLRGGFHRRELVSLAAATSIGKTSMAVTMGHNLTLKSGRSMALLSVEMDRRAILNKFLAIQCQMDWDHLTGRNLTDAEKATVRAANERIVEMSRSGRFDIIPAGGMTISKIRSAALAQAAKAPLDTLVLDYLQLVVAEKAENRNLAVADISRGLKFLAEELDCVVVALSQLSRDYARHGGRPELHHLRDSGAIEQDADIVILLSPVLQKQISPAGMVDESVADWKQRLFREVLVDVAKNRVGPTGTLTLGLNGPRMEFVDIERHGVPTSKAAGMEF